MKPVICISKSAFNVSTPAVIIGAVVVPALAAQPVMMPPAVVDMS